MNYILKLQDWYNAKQLREQIILLCLFLLCIFAVWKIAFFDKITIRNKNSESEISVTHRKIKALEKEFLDIKAGDAQIAILKKQVEVSQEELNKISAKIDNFTRNLISPKEMTTALRAILESTPNLKLTKIESIPARQVSLSQISKADRKQIPEQDFVSLYVHGLLLEFEGDYFSTYNYLLRLENLKWQLLWDNLSYKVDKYPIAKVKVLVHTLSDNEAWIGT